MTLIAPSTPPPPIIDSTGKKTLYQIKSINDIYHNNTTSSNDVQQPSSDENNEHSLIGGNVWQIENNESNSAIVQHEAPRTSSPLSQRVSNRELTDLGPVLQSRRIVLLTLHHREINGNIHQTFCFEDDIQHELGTNTLYYTYTLLTSLTNEYTPKTLNLKGKKTQLKSFSTTLYLAKSVAQRFEFNFTNKLSYQNA